MAIERPLRTPEFSADDAVEVVVDVPMNPAATDVDFVVMDGDDDSLLDIIEGTLEPPVFQFDENIAERVAVEDEKILGVLGADLVELVNADMRARSEWTDMYVDGLETLGFKIEHKTQPWDGACGVQSTVMGEAIIRFQAETMSETFPAAGPVKTKIIGDETPEKKDAATRVDADMNYQVTEVMTEYRSEHERMLYNVGLAGSAFKKVYFEPKLNRQTAMFVGAEDIIVPYGETTIELAERVTHVMRKTVNEMALLKAKGFYRDFDLDPPKQQLTDVEDQKKEDTGVDVTDTDDSYTLYEIHADLIIEGVDDDPGMWGEYAGLAKPYIVTVEASTNTVLAIYRNWEEADEFYAKKNYFVHYTYLTGFGFYGLGLVHLVGGYAKAGTSIIRQLVDAGTLANLPGGFKSRELRNKNEDEPIEPGEWRDVDVTGQSLKDHIMPLPYKEPSQTLLKLLEIITSEGRRMGAVADIDISDMSANAPVGTTLALLERALKPMAGIQARMHASMKQEFKLLKRMIADYTDGEYSYQPYPSTELPRPQVRRTDYSMVEVIPVSDPNSSTLAQRIVQYQVVMQLANDAPQIYQQPQLHRQMLDVIGIPNADKLVPLPEDAVPLDPVSENMNVLMGTPLKAFIYQDHAAHLAAHTSFMQDPMIMGAIGQNPQAKAMMAALQDHIAEHMAFNYRKQMEEKLGVALPPPGEPLPEEFELQLSRAVADGQAQLTQTHQQQAAQQQAQAEAEDPHLQLERAKVAGADAERQRKERKDNADIALRAEEQERKRVKDYIDAMLAKEELANDRRKTDAEAAKVGVELQNERTEMDRRVKLDLLKQLSDTFSSDNYTNQGGGDE